MPILFLRAGSVLLFGLTAHWAAAQTFTTVTNFHGGPDGETPRGAPIQGRDGNLYGTTSGFTVPNDGTIYRGHTNFRTEVNSTKTDQRSHSIARDSETCRDREGAVLQRAHRSPHARGTLRSAVVKASSGK
jgi:hypothetical protein